MNVIWLSDDKISNLEQKLKDAEFIDEESIFKSLREYFLESYKTIDLTVYKTLWKRKCIKLFFMTPRSNFKYIIMKRKIKCFLMK